MDTELLRLEVASANTWYEQVEMKNVEVHRKLRMTSSKPAKWKWQDKTYAVHTHTFGRTTFDSAQNTWMQATSKEKSNISNTFYVALSEQTRRKKIISSEWKTGKKTAVVNFAQPSVG